MYHECIQLTRQFAFCPNAFRVDLYKGCDFGCKYCFANMDGFKITDNDNKVADIEKLKKLFYKALETDIESKDILVELLRHNVPIHCGGMSDPFQSREWKYGLTKQFIELSNQYNYPVQFSTKTSKLPDEYVDILNPNIHAFQFSICGWNEEYIKKWESNTDTAENRLKLIDNLRSKSIWCSIRIQPLIDIDEALTLLYNITGNIDYITIEHFKLIFDTKKAKDSFLQLIKNPEDYVVYNHKVQLKKQLKIKNILKVQELANSYGIDVGVGDNDLHYMTQGKTCCGIDRIPAFKNYLKYNLCCMSIDGINEDVFIPKCNPRKHINDQKFGNIIDCKEYADEYIKSHLDYLGNRKDTIAKYFGVYKKRLF